MTDEEKIIRVNTLKDFDRDGDETLEVPAWMPSNTASSPRNRNGLSARSSPL